MQTFLPYASFLDTAFVLDDKRLGKQRVEAYQILRCLQGKTEGWKHHPAVKQWEGFEQALMLYGIVMCAEWKRRGFNDSLFHSFADGFRSWATPPMPTWLGLARFHASHRSNLLRKNPEWYGKFGWDVPPDLPYVWPSKEEVCG